LVDGSDFAKTLGQFAQRQRTHEFMLVEGREKDKLKIAMKLADG
jgi:hypothetical protein